MIFTLPVLQISHIRPSGLFLFQICIICILHIMLLQWSHIE